MTHIAPAGARPVATLLCVLGLAPLATGTSPSPRHAVSPVASTPVPVGAVQHDPPPLQGAHMIQQLSSGRFLDAHDTPDKDFGVVTRPFQKNATQRWIFHHEGGGIYTIQHEHTLRFLDAHDTANLDFAVVTRPRQPNTTQRWIVLHLGTRQGGHLYAIRQLSTRRFLDAHEVQSRDFAVVTRPQQSGNQSSATQRWFIH